MKNVWGKFFEAIPPKINKRRTEFSVAHFTPSLMLVISRKIGDVPDVLEVSQSDYVDAWDEDDKFKNYTKSDTFRARLYKKIPNILKQPIFSLWTLYIHNVYIRRHLDEYYTHIKGFSKPKK